MKTGTITLTEQDRDDLMVALDAAERGKYNKNITERWQGIRKQLMDLEMAEQEEEVLTLKGDNDYVLGEDCTAWIEVGGLVVWIVPKNPGVMVEVYPTGKEMDESLAFCDADE